MPLSSALSNALSGLRVTQRDLQITSGNISNAGVDGYSRRRVAYQDLNGGELTVGVRATVVRELDLTLQTQMRTASAASSFADLRAKALGRLDQMFGKPGADGALDTVLNSFGSALDRLVTSPNDRAFQLEARDRASELVNVLHQLTDEVQAQRSEAEVQIADRVDRVNELLIGVADLNEKIVQAGSRTDDLLGLEDARDEKLSELSKLLPIKVLKQSNNTVALMTPGGASLLDVGPNKLVFDARGTLAAGQQWSADPALRGTGTIRLQTLAGFTVDLIAEGQVRSGELGAWIDIRDSIMVEAQNQLDALAGALAGAFTPRDVAGTAASAGAATGFSLDLSTLPAGNAITVDRVVNGTAQRIRFVAAGQPVATPTAVSPTAGEKIVQIDFSAGATSVASQIAAALGTGFGVSASGNVLTILDDGAAGTTDVAGVTGTDPVLRLFTDDGPTPYAGTQAPSAQRTGFAGRLSLNPALKSDISQFVSWTASAPSGDPTRVRQIAERFRNDSFTFGADVGLGSGGSTFRGSVAAFTRQVVSQRGAAASAAERVAEGQEIVKANLESRWTDANGVDIDNEMARLITIQNAYAANARVLSTVRELFDILMNV